MSRRNFLDSEARRRATAVIRQVEAGTSLEIVVAVRHQASRHFGTSAALGLAFALGALAIMWFSPTPYDVRTMPLDALVAFVLGALSCVLVPELRRVLTPRRFLAAHAERAARRTFDELGVEKTRARSGLLVYVALFERAAVLVPDAGLVSEPLLQALSKARVDLDQAVKRGDFDGFLAVLLGLGPVAAAALPRKPDDENELCDDVA
jgi:putative membrane protein